MKSFLPLLIAFAGIIGFSQTVAAQTVGQGSWMVGGSAGFQSIKPKNSPGSNSIINFSPNLGYFIADDLAIGLGLNLTSLNPDVGESSTDFGVGPFVRYYFVDPIFAQVGVNLGLGDSEFTEFQVGIGYSWFLSNGVAIEPMVFYNSHGVDGDAGDYSVFGLSIGVQAFANHDHGME